MVSEYEFVGGYPTPETVRAAYDAVDLNRAIQCYRLFFPTVSGLAIMRGNAVLGLELNERFGTLATKPMHVGLTLNSDTPYAPLLLDLTDGPFVIEMPAGPLICIAMDLNQRWVLDMGLPGPDAGAGGKHLLLPPGFDGEIPGGFHVGRSSTNKVIVGIRSLPLGGDVPAATARLSTVAVHPLTPGADWVEPEFIDLDSLPQDTTPNAVEGSFAFWEALNEIVQTEPPLERFAVAYGELGALGIEKGSLFAPDERMRRILEAAAVEADAQLRVESLADRRPDRVVWPGIQWEWAALRFENGDFEGPQALDSEARDKWFFQAIGASPAMFRRDTKAGSLYWLGSRDSTGAYLNGSNNYTLTVPLPVPGKLFWSVTVYDARTRSQIQTDQGNALISSLFDLDNLGNEDSITLHFGPNPPRDAEQKWIKTIPDAGWFTYFRIYGPEQPAFDTTWSLPDITQA
ncbi:DUF1254 domain-containing protein [Planctomonas sp. JC2975]|uniref:DUF1214 domain-containing protein n=1 Tax=Planctomonas sp. JC2975 TaxID=2729626 RepID=UPI00197C728D